MNAPNQNTNEMPGWQVMLVCGLAFVVITGCTVAVQGGQGFDAEWWTGHDQECIDRWQEEDSFTRGNWSLKEYCGG